MGLSIITYNYGYTTLHQLRQLALRSEGNLSNIDDFYTSNQKTKYSAFIMHSDCEGCYVVYGTPQHKAEIMSWGDNPLYVGDLTKLKQEIKELDSYMQENAKDLLPAWNSFKFDVSLCKTLVQFG